MLKVRFARAGRKGRPFYHVVVTEHTKPSQSGYQKKLGWYDPLSKKHDIDVEAVKERLAHGAQLSKSVEKMFKRNNIKVS